MTDSAEYVPFQPWAQDLLHRVYNAQLAEHGDADRASWHLLDFMEELAPVKGDHRG